MDEQSEKQSESAESGTEVEHRDEDAVSATRKLTRATYILAGVTFAGIVVTFAGIVGPVVYR